MTDVLGYVVKDLDFGFYYVERNGELVIAWQSPPPVSLSNAKRVAKRARQWPINPPKHKFVAVLGVTP